MNEWTVFEPKSGRYFKMDFDDLMQKIDFLNDKINNGIRVWNDVFRVLGLPAISLGEMPIDCDKISSHLDFSIDTGDLAPLTIIDYIKKTES